MDFENLSYPWKICTEEAWNAFLQKTVPIGACLIDEYGKLISRGRNHIYDDEPTDGITPWVSKHKLAHAELNCLLGARDRVTFHGTTIYSTVEPCPLCMGAIYMAGVRNIQFAVSDPYAGSTDLIEKTWYLSVKKMQIDACDNEVFVTLMAAWNFYFFFYEKKRRGEYWASSDDVMSKWTLQHAEAYQLARKVWQQYPVYQGPFMQMNAVESMQFWEAQL